MTPTADDVDHLFTQNRCNTCGVLISIPFARLDHIEKKHPELWVEVIQALALQQEVEFLDESKATTPFNIEDEPDELADEPVPPPAVSKPTPPPVPLVHVPPPAPQPVPPPAPPPEPKVKCPMPHCTAEGTEEQVKAHVSTLQFVCCDKGCKAAYHTKVECMACEDKHLEESKAKWKAKEEAEWAAMEPWQRRAKWEKDKEVGTRAEWSSFGRWRKGEKFNE